MSVYMVVLSSKIKRSKRKTTLAKQVESKKMEIRHHITTLIESINTLLKVSESIEQQKDVGEQTMSKAQKIKDELTKDKEILQEMDELCKSEGHHGREKLQLEGEITNLKARVVKFEEDLRQKDEEITQLKAKVEGHENKFKEMESSLQTGQIAFEFEKDLAKYIYPGDKKFSSRKIFTNMKKWLEDKKDTDQGRKANERWNALKNEFSWSSEHEEVFFKLLESRRKFAHPSRDQNVAQFPIPDCFSDKEKKCIEVINKMIKRVSILLQQ